MLALRPTEFLAFYSALGEFGTNFWVTHDAFVELAGYASFLNHAGLDILVRADF